MALVKIISDGGGDGRRGAGAAVVYLPVADMSEQRRSDEPESDSSSDAPSLQTHDGRYKLVALLGSVDSTEAELAAGLLGFLFLHRWAALRNRPPLVLEWISDNEHLIQFGRSLPALDQRRREPLWQLASQLTAGWTVSTSHVSTFPGSNSLTRAHHSCDRASTWIQRKGELLLQESGAGPIGRLHQQNPDRCWQLSDLRPLLEVAGTLTPEELERNAVGFSEQFDPLVR